MMPLKTAVCLPLTFCLIAVLAVDGQTSNELAAKFPRVSAYEVRPGILMTARYATDGQACEMVLEARHYKTEQIDLGSTISRKLEDSLIDALAPENQRGKPTRSRWLSTDVGGGVTYTRRDFENVQVDIYGAYCGYQSRSSTKQIPCNTSGDEVVVIHWKKRRCTVVKPTRAGTPIAHVSRPRYHAQ